MSVIRLTKKKKKKKKGTVEVMVHTGFISMIYTEINPIKSVTQQQARLKRTEKFICKNEEDGSETGKKSLAKLDNY